MDSAQRFASAAARWLAAQLAGGGPGPLRPGVAEVASREGGPAELSPEAAEALRRLARAVVEAVLALPGQSLDAAAASKIIETAAQKHLLGMPPAATAWRARLAGKIPALLDLPRLAGLAAEGLYAPPLAVLGDAAGPLVGGRGEAFARLLADVERVARIDLPVALIGETGTGKELMARRLHHLSPRREGPFLAVNCAALAETLLESELFGHEKGAFTGAERARLGHLRAARGGTLFLDEINGASPLLQAKLLRALEDMAVIPLGSSRAEPLDFRLIVASSEDLERAAEAGRFSWPLYYRVMVLPLRLPPLRQRREDLPALIEHFRGRACLAAKCTRRLSPQAVDALCAYHWPGNVRQLRNVVQRAVALAPRFEIGPEDLPAEVRGGSSQAWEAGLESRLAGLGGVLAAKAAPLARVLHAKRGALLFNKDLREALEISDTTAKGILRELTAAGLVQARGQRGGRRYLVEDI